MINSGSALVIITLRNHINLLNTQHCHHSLKNVTQPFIPQFTWIGPALAPVRNTEKIDRISSAARLSNVKLQSNPPSYHPIAISIRGTSSNGDAARWNQILIRFVQNALFHDMKRTNHVLTLYFKSLDRKNGRITKHDVCIMLRCSLLSN